MNTKTENRMRNSLVRVEKLPDQSAGRGGKNTKKTERTTNKYRGNQQITWKHENE
jgi:hypothetical protein